MEDENVRKAKLQWFKIKNHYDAAADKCIELMLSPNVTSEQLSQAASALRRIRDAVLKARDEIARASRISNPPDSEEDLSNE